LLNILRQQDEEEQDGQVPLRSVLISYRAQAA
jgi:hypothetical protein